MVDAFSVQLGSRTAVGVARRAAAGWWLWYICLIGFTCLIGLAMLLVGPHPALVAALVYLAGAAAIVYRPRYGLYIVIALALASDNVLMPWFPFTKNASSRESLLYVSDALIVSPMEIYLALTFVAWLGRAAMRRKLAWYGGPLLRPALVFAGFMIFGLVYGLASGGDLNIALWEVRPIFYLPAMLVLVGNLITTRKQVGRLLWAAAIGVFLEGLAGAWHVAVDLGFNISSVDAIAEHSSAIHANAFFVLLAAAWLFRAPAARRSIMLLMLPPVAITYFANQRRAGFISLGIAIVLIFAVIYWENRRLFWRLVPVVSVVALIYLGAFWNSSGAIGQPARAVRSVVAADGGDAADNSSNEYRVLENVNILATIKAKPLTGVGFGNKFFLAVAMPDISFFIWWNYITHNSIAWIWMQAGVGGFLAMLYMVGLSIAAGVRVLRRMPGGELSAAALTAVVYIVMHFVFAYVDMSWDVQSMLFVGVAMGLINSLERIAARPVALPPKRWPWLPDQAPIPGLRSP